MALDPDEEGAGDPAEQGQLGRSRLREVVGE
jgi:hypothetical protein